MYEKLISSRIELERELAILLVGEVETNQKVQFGSKNCGVTNKTQFIHTVYGSHYVLESGDGDVPYFSNLLLNCSGGLVCIRRAV